MIFALPPPPGSDIDFTMRIYNSDGSEPEMCGNGIRCLARFVADADGVGDGRQYRIHTGAGLIQPLLLPDGQVRVDMGAPILDAQRVPTTLPSTRADGAAVAAPLQTASGTWLMTCVGMGNPHAVTFGKEDGTPVKVPAREWGSGAGCAWDVWPSHGAGLPRARQKDGKLWRGGPVWGGSGCSESGSYTMGYCERPSRDHGLVV